MAPVPVQPPPSHDSEQTFRLLRQQMVDEHLRPRDIIDPRVLRAMEIIPRHRFVESHNLDWAYSDRPLPIGQSQTISQPYIVAYMTQAAKISPSSIVLEIGTGSGYQSAILGKLAKTVYSVERIHSLAQKACRRLYQLGYINIHVKVGDGYEGWPSHAPYDAILVTAAPKTVPQTLVDQLAMNGRLVIPVGDRDQEIQIFTRTPEGVVVENAIAVRFVPMVKNA